jgi:hypothetical protein
MSIFKLYRDFIGYDDNTQQGIHALDAPVETVEDSLRRQHLSALIEASDDPLATRSAFLAERDAVERHEWACIEQTWIDFLGG